MSVKLSYRERSRQFVRVLLLRDWRVWQRSIGGRIARFAILGCFLYIAVLFVLLALEDRFLFPGATVARPWCEAPEYLRVRELTFCSSTGDDIRAWFSAPEGWQPNRGAILISHGNGSSLSREPGRAYRWRERLGRAVLLYDYPGYGKSSGRPSEAGCYAAGEAAMRWLFQAQGISANEIILVGESMGGAIAVELAKRYTTRLLILQGAFTSFPDMAQVRVPIYPSRHLVHNRMDNEAKIQHVQCPVLIAHGTADRVVPYSQGERLFLAAHEPKLFFPVEGHGHGPPNTDDWFETVKTFLCKTAR
jgi:pimeloyl-ACP methyl ester carboxylesterase